jgi:hypothetical protein
VYTRVSHYNDWITSEVCRLSSDPPPICSQGPTPVSPRTPAPTPQPSSPSIAPVDAASSHPTNIPSVQPSQDPTADPTVGLSVAPSSSPTTSESPSSTTITPLPNISIRMTGSVKSTIALTSVLESHLNTYLMNIDGFVRTNLIQCRRNRKYARMLDSPYNFRGFAVFSSSDIPSSTMVVSTTQAALQDVTSFNRALIADSSIGNVTFLRAETSTLTPTRSPRQRRPA